MFTVIILNFRTDRSGQTVQTQNSLIRVFTICFSICIFLVKYPKVWHLCLNFRLIIARFSCVRKFRNFKVIDNFREFHNHRLQSLGASTLIMVGTCSLKANLCQSSVKCSFEVPFCFYSVCFHVEIRKIIF